MSFKNLIWLIFTILILSAVFITTDPAPLYNMNLLYFFISAVLFFISTVFWMLAWKYLMGEPLWISFKINTKALAGIFAPIGLGGDILRTHFAKKQGISGAKALSASFVVKFFKFLLMFFYLLIAVFMLAQRSVEFPDYIVVFISALLLTIFGAIFILFLRTRFIIKFIHKITRKVSVWRVRDELKAYFFKLSAMKSAYIFILLIISTFFELASIYFALIAVGQYLLWIHIFILGAVIHSLALITITPQGVGFVEAGGYFILTFGYFSVPRPIIGSFLIIWNLVRLWVPSLIGGIVAFLDRRKS